MNRIILIGNGFDLAHGLPTSYLDFINYYWESRVGDLCRCAHNTETDGLSTLSIRDNSSAAEYGAVWKSFMSVQSFSDTSSKSDLIELIKRDTDNFETKMCPFFRAINTALETKNWVDIENEYYLLLKRIVNKDDLKYRNPQKLDSELELIKRKLVAYLTVIENDNIKDDLLIDTIKKAIFEPFSIRDISIEGKDAFLQFLKDRWSLTQTDYKVGIKRLLQKYGYSEFEMQCDVGYYLDATPDFEKHTRNIFNKTGILVPDFYLLPDQILLLNFNYTRTADLYVTKKSGFQVNHIHGELANPEGIIFGYGDELDEDYKQILNLNDNGYLANIKSIRYLETDNYRRLLSYIDSAPYQIYIMGHSCGNSDRTLLNTLFEHKNCLSIKPFYYQKEEETNYIEIIQNISRDFNDMRLMRDRVVNKEYCKPLVNKSE